MRHASVGLRLFAGCLVFFCGVLHTQKVLAQSEKPVIIDGTKYIIHQVEKGHTLYAISKKYAISMDALLSANPGASAGVKVGDRLRIPVDKMDKMATTGSSPQIQSDLLIHTVAKKETLYSLARRYDITPAEILSANPGLGSTLSEGQLLRIPVKKGKNGQPSFYKEAEEEIATIHVVGANETLYSLSKLFNVSIDEIKAANGGLPQGLILGQTIKIPKKGEFERNSESSSSGTFPAPKGESMFTTQTPTPSNNSAVTRNAEYASGGSLKVVMMLPFEAARLDSVDKLGHDQVALEFYQGALIALDTVRSMGTDLNVYIYDSNKDGKRVKEIATKPDLNNADLFIGPMYKSELLALAEVSGARQAHIVCPVPQSGGILMNRPFISKAHCDDATQLSALTRFINR
ncbi:MAG TPA: LysM peptidoglycan-binding domain-containing protein, partial [Luteibaculaceae bacterium]|nr:LysM peptidoglycan-binding domain-containing protein [Luteibaculaceae bacterium]